MQSHNKKLVLLQKEEKAASLRHKKNSPDNAICFDLRRCGIFRWQAYSSPQCENKVVMPPKPKCKGERLIRSPMPVHSEFSDRLDPFSKSYAFRCDAVEGKKYGFKR